MVQPFLARMLSQIDIAGGQFKKIWKIRLTAQPLWCFGWIKVQLRPSRGGVQPGENQNPITSKNNNMKMTFHSALAALCGLIASAGSSSAETIISDSFPGTPADYTVGQNLPTASSVGTYWTVSNGTVTAGNGQATLNGDQAAMSIGFGTVVPNARTTVSFEVLNFTQTTGNFRFDFALKDSTTGLSYVQKATPAADYFGTSGFNSYNGAGDEIAGASGAALSSNGAWDAMVYTFDPTTGVTLTQNGVLVASWPNFHNLTKVDSFSVSAPTGVAPYVIQNLSVDVTPPLIISHLYFYGGSPPYTLGQSFAPDYSAAGTSWTVTSGTVDFFNGFAARPSLNGGGMSISFGTVAPNTSATVSFKLGNIFGAAGSYLTAVALSDSATGQSYVQSASPNPLYYGTSGFHSYNNSGTLIAGASGAAISTSGWDLMEFSFSPTSGVTLKQNGVLVASWSNYLNLTKVDTFSFSVLNDAPFGIYDVTVKAALNSGPPTYSSWATDNAGSQAANLDYDQDGVSNGVEYFMNAAPGFTANPGLVGNTVTWANGGNISADTYGTKFIVQTSSDLVTWDEVAEGDLNNTAGSLSYSIDPANGPAKQFVRLKVTP